MGIIVSAVMMTAFVSCGDKGGGKKSSSSSEPAVYEEFSASDYESKESDVVSIVSYELGKDAQDFDILNVTFRYTNTSSDEDCFGLIFDDRLYHHDVQCVSPVYTNDGIGEISRYHNIPAGATEEITVPFSLYDKSAATIVIKEKFSLDYSYIFCKTLDLGGGAGYKVPADPGETTVTIADHYVKNDGNGDPVLYVIFEFHNGFENAAAFAYELSSGASQNGQKLQRASSVVPKDAVLASAYLQPGASTRTYSAYALDGKSEVNVRVTDIFDSIVYLDEMISVD